MTRSRLFLLVALPVCLAACLPAGPPPPGGDGSPAAAPATPSPAVPEPRLVGTPLARALAAALADTPVRDAAAAGEAAAEAALSRAGAAFRPSFNIGLEASANTAGADGVVPTARATQRLYDGGVARAGQRAAAARRDAARADSGDSLAARAFDGVTAWESLAVARQALRVIVDAQDRHAGVAAQVEQRLAAGAGRQAEALRVASRGADLAARRAAAEGRIAAAEARLAEIFGHVPAAVGPLPPAPPPAGGRPGAHPALAALRAETEAAEADLARAEAGARPTVFLDITGQAPLDDDPALGAGLRLDYPVGTAGRQKAAVAEARARRDAAVARRALETERLSSAYRQAAARAAALTREVAAARAAEEAAAAALADARAQLRAGRADIVDLLDLGRDLDLARAARLEVESRQRLTGYEMLRLTGGLMPALGLCAAGCGG
ncbi:TolC family protein [Rhodovulum sp. YNF3179]|uniref:TolC family protein n=1 Tax=Rhodovulum sp. YNF3179 TaxID=3425127 RepID=UPI003D33E73E